MIGRVVGESNKSFFNFLHTFIHHLQYISSGFGHCCMLCLLCWVLAHIIIIILLIIYNNNKNKKYNNVVVGCDFKFGPRFYNHYIRIPS